MHRVSLAQGEVLYREGDPGEVAFYILDGRIATERHGKAAHAGTGTLIGLSALVDRPYAATARAEEPSDVLAFTRRELRSIFRSDPDRALAIIDALINLLGQIHTLEDQPQEDQPQGPSS